MAHPLERHQSGRSTPVECTLHDSEVVGSNPFWSSAFLSTYRVVLEMAPRRDTILLILMKSRLMVNANKTGR